MAISSRVLQSYIHTAISLCEEELYRAPNFKHPDDLCGAILVSRFLDGWTGEQGRAWLRESEEWRVKHSQPPPPPDPPAPPPPLPPPTVPPRAGIVTLQGRMVVDHGGPFLAVGTSLFWASWAVVHDQARLRENLAFLADYGVDYIRVLGTSWAGTDRAMPADDVGPRLRQLAHLAYDEYGLRLEVAIFGDLSFVPERADRGRVVTLVSEALHPVREKIFAVEIANEAFSTGWADKVGELTVYARMLRDSWDLVAVSSPPAIKDWRAWYDGSDANLLTVHHPRDHVGAGIVGAWRPIRQTWDPWLESSLAWSNDEGIGPQSSVAWDDDPVRLTMFAALTWLCGGAAFTLHTGAGVSGGGALAAPHPNHPFQRVANVFEVEHIRETLSGIRTVRSLLPADLPNWTRHNANRNFPGYPFDIAPLVPMIESTRLIRVFAATHAGRVICMPIGVQDPVPFTPRSPLHVDVYDPMTGALVEAYDQPFTLMPRPAAILIGHPL